MSNGRIAIRLFTPYRTPISTSFDGVLVPHEFCPRSRTKYVPLPTSVASRLVTVVPVSLTTIFVPPENDPASMTYEVGEPAEAFHASVTVDPLTPNLSPVGALGGPLQSTVLLTTNTTSLEGPPVPKRFVARTRTKKSPAGTLPTDNDVATLPVEKLARSLSPGDDPAEITYAAGLPPDLGTFHASVTVDPLTLVTSPLGTPGAPGACGPTVTITSFEGGLVPAPFVARTRTK